MKSKISFAILVLVTLFSSPYGWAESIGLATGEIVEGKILDFPKEITLELPDGTKTKVSYEAISSIFKTSTPPSFSPFPTKKEPKDPKAPLDKQGKIDSSEFDELGSEKSPYASPISTFQSWKKAALADDTDGMVNCYTAYRKGEVKKELKRLSKKTRQEMKLAMQETIFTPSDPYYQGESAIMEVSWTKGLASQTQTLKFVLENKEWKISE